MVHQLVLSWPLQPLAKVQHLPQHQTISQPVWLYHLSVCCNSWAYDLIDTKVNAVCRVPIFLAKKFQVIPNFCPGQNGHSPGICAVNFGTTKEYTNCILKLQEHQNKFQYNIAMLYMLTFRVLYMFSAKFLDLSRCSYFWGQIPG